MLKEALAFREEGKRSGNPVCRSGSEKPHLSRLSPASCHHPQLFSRPYPAA